MSGAKRLIEAASGVEVLKNVPLSKFTSFGIGGPASLFANVNTGEALSGALTAAKQAGIDLFVIGGGTNLLVSDDGFDGLVVKTAFDTVEIDSKRCTARIGAGVPTTRLVEQLIDSGLGGLEFAAGLPGTIGGALAGNAGCFGKSVSDALTEATVIDRDGGTMRIRDPKWFCFDYRESRLLNRGEVLTEAVFALKNERPEALRSEAKRCLATRAERHPPWGTKTAGSYFKNLPPANPGEQRRSAGALLDQVGAKGLSVGDAAVFERHANMIINKGNATAAQVLALAEEMARRVSERFGVELCPEVRFVGKRPGAIRDPL